MKSRGLDQAYRMQDFAFETAMAIRDNLTQDGRVLAPDKDTAQMIGVLGKVWRDAQDQIRVHRGKPLPGSLSHEKVRSGGSAKRTLAQLSVLSAEQAAPEAQSA